MADTKISALTAASALAGTEVVPAVQSSTTKKATIDQIATRVATAIVPAYTAYTPTIDAATPPTMGTGATATGYYGQVGKRVFGYALINFGTGAAAGTGSYGLLLPAVPVDRNQPIGTGYLADTSDNSRQILCAAVVVPALFAASTSRCILLVGNAPTDGFGDGNNPVGATVPFTFADSDSIGFQFDYEAA